VEIMDKLKLILISLALVLITLSGIVGYTMGFQNGETYIKRPIYLRVNNHSVVKAMDVANIEKSKQTIIIQYLKGE